ELGPVHGLDHLDRHELVVGAGEVPPVPVEHRDPVAELGRIDPLEGGVVLVGGAGGGRDPTAAGGGGVDGEAARVGAALEQVGVGPATPRTRDTTGTTASSSRCTGAMVRARRRRAPTRSSASQSPST